MTRIIRQLWPPAHFTTAEPEHDQQHRADADRRIGDVERRPRPLLVVDLDEIGHAAEAQAVDQVAERAADHERERQRRAPFAARQAPQPDHEHGADTDRERAEQPALPAAGVVQETERGAGVEGERPVEETRNHRVRRVRRQRRQCDLLGELVERDDDGGERKPDQCVLFVLHEAFVLVTDIDAVIRRMRIDFRACRGGRRALRTSADPRPALRCSSRNARKFQDAPDSTPTSGR